MTSPSVDTSSRLGTRGDDVYSALLDAHTGLDDVASARLNARLVLILANQLGDPDLVLSAIAKARAFSSEGSHAEASD